MLARRTASAWCNGWRAAGCSGAAADLTYTRSVPGTPETTPPARLAGSGNCDRVKPKEAYDHDDPSARRFGGLCPRPGAEWPVRFGRRGHRRSSALASAAQPGIGLSGAAAYRGRMASTADG